MHHQFCVIMSCTSMKSSVQILIKSNVFTKFYNDLAIYRTSFSPNILNTSVKARSSYQEVTLESVYIYSSVREINIRSKGCDSCVPAFCPKLLKEKVNQIQMFILWRTISSFSQSRKLCASAERSKSVRWTKVAKWSIVRSNAHGLLVLKDVFSMKFWFNLSKLRK